MTATDRPSGTIDRRTFVKAAGTAALGVGAAAGSRPDALAADAGQPVAETIYRGGTILTMVDAHPRVEAVAVSQGRIVAAGTDRDVMGLASPATRIVDLAGRTLMPSFIDAHGHFANAPQLVGWVNVSGAPAGPVSRIADIVAALKDHAARTGLKPGDWLIGYGYDMSSLAEGRELTRDDLDPSFPDNPVLLIHSSNHGAVLNSAAFAEVGVDAETPTPPGGLILRREGSNEPAGLLMETAFLPIFGSLPQPSEADLLDAMDAAQQIYVRVGVTTAQEGATHVRDLQLIRKAGVEGRLFIDIVCLPMVLEVPKLVREYAPDFTGGPMELPDAAASAFGTYRDRVKLAGVKLVLDGSPHGKTAFWSKPLLTPGPAGEANWRGVPLFPPESIIKAAGELYAKGVPVFAHCNGDASIDMMIDAARAAGVTAADDRRTVIIHSQFVRPDQLDDYVELGFSPSYFTVHAFFWGDIHVENLGEERAYFLSPMAASKAKGIRFSTHNDFSVTPMEPMRMVWSAVQRTSRSGRVIGPDQRVDAATALKALTIDAAWQIREEDIKGTIEPGKLADLVILDADPTTVEPDAILNIAVLETFKEGRSVYRKPA
jgi:predicted amidohydrolase YtcJ